MPSEKILDAKKAVVAELAEELKSAQTIVLADYLGLTVEQDTEMRAAFRKAGVTYKVVKNTISSRAFEEAGIKEMGDLLKGPTAIALSSEDIIAPAKVTKEFADKFDKITIKGGAMEGAVTTVDEINKLASIPAPEVLQGQLVFTLLSPITSLAIALSEVAKKMDGGTEEAAAE